jgi:hypothetical protein
MFWDVIACSQLNVNRRFGGKCGVQFEDPRVSKVRKQHGFSTRRWRQHVSSKYLLTFTELHFAIFQKVEFFIATNVET